MDPSFFLTGLWLIEVRRQPLPGVLVLAGAMLIKEDVPIYVAALACYFAFTGRRRVALGLGVASVAYGGFVARFGFPGLFAGPGAPYALSAWAAFGSTIPQILGYFLARPMDALQLFWTPTLPRLLGSFGFLPLLSPGTLLAAVPGLFVSFSGSHLQRHLAHYYAAPVLPILAWATIGGLRRVQRRMPPAAVYALVAVLVLLNVQYVQMFRVTKRDGEGLALIRTLPAAASIAAPSHLVPHFPKREKIYVVGATWRHEPVDVVLLDLRRRGWPLRRPAVAALASELEVDPAYRKVVERRGYVLFRRSVVDPARWSPAE